MKNLLFLCLFAATFMPLQAEKPKRYFEIGMDVDAGAANNYLGLSDFFNKERVLVIDPGKMPDAGFWINSAGGTDVFLNLNFGKKFGLGFFTGLDYAIYGNVSAEVFKLLADGNENMRDFTGTVLAGASVFADAGLATRFKFGKLSLSVGPAVYFPLMYVPPPTVRYHVDTREGVKAEVTVDANAYTPFSFEDMLPAGLGNDSPGGASGKDGGNAFPLTTNELWQVLESWGLDVSLNAEYKFRPRLDFGGSITNIPLYAATLHHGLNYQFNYLVDPFEVPSPGDGSSPSGGSSPDDGTSPGDGSSPGEGTSLSDLISGDGFKLENPSIEDPVFYDDLSFRVLRPLRFDFYLLYRPLSTQLIVLKPNIGFSALTVFGNEADNMCFNAGLEAQLNLKRIFTLSLATGYREKLWRHSLGLMLNLRILELDLGLALQSQDFVGSFLIQGAGAYVGFRFGF